MEGQRILFPTHRYRILKQPAQLRTRSFMRSLDVPVRVTISAHSDHLELLPEPEALLALDLRPLKSTCEAPHLGNPPRDILAFRSVPGGTTSRPRRSVESSPALTEAA